MSVMTAILIGPLSAARAGGAAMDEQSIASASVAGKEREKRIGPTLGAGTRIAPSLRIPGAVPPSGRTKNGNEPDDVVSDRRLRAHRRHPHRGPRAPRRLDRLALPAVFRLGGVLRSLGRRC